MAKNNMIFFNHNTNLRNDLRIKAVRKKFSLMGYAIVLMLIEIAMEESDYSLSWAMLDKEIIASDLDIEVEDLEAVVNYCVKVGMFTMDNDVLCCMPFILECLDDKLINISVRLKRQEAGKLGAAKRWGKNSDNENVELEIEGTNEEIEALITSGDEVLEEDDNTTSQEEELEAKTGVNLTEKTAQQKVLKVSANSKMANAIFAILCHREPFFSKNFSAKPAEIDDREENDSKKEKKADKKKKIPPTPPYKEKKLTKKERESVQCACTRTWDFAAIAKLWNEVCVSLPAVTTLSKQRKDKIALRLEEMKVTKENALNFLRPIFEKIQASSFLKGQTGNWRANFDWFFANQTNWIKVSEGNYDHEKQNNSQPKKQSDNRMEIDPNSYWQ